MCSSTQETQLTSDMCFPTWETIFNITSDICSPIQETHTTLNADTTLRSERANLLEGVIMILSDIFEKLKVYQCYCECPSPFNACYLIYTPPPPPS